MLLIIAQKRHVMNALDLQRLFEPETWAPPSHNKVERLSWLVKVSALTCNLPATSSSVNQLLDHIRTHHTLPEPETLPTTDVRTLLAAVSNLNSVYTNTH